MFMKLTEAYDKLLAISNYEKNWDTYGAEPFSMSLIQSVKDMLDIIQQQKIPCEITDLFAGIDGIYVNIFSENAKQSWEFFDDGEIWLEFGDSWHIPPNEPTLRYKQIEETWSVFDALQQHFIAVSSK